MNVEFVSICWDECDGCKGEENQPMENKRRGKEIARKNVWLFAYYLQFLEDRIKGVCSTKKARSCLDIQKPKADLDISTLSDCDSIERRTINVIEVADRRRYTCCEYDSDGLVKDAGQNITFSTFGLPR